MEYFEDTSSNYYKALRNKSKRQKIRIEILTTEEHTVGEIEPHRNQITGTISVNMQQGIRRTCDITIADKFSLYIPTSNSPFWYDKKFRILIGIQFNNDTFWFSQGVFVVKDVSCDGRSMTISGVDKYGILTDEINSGMCMYKYQILAKNGATVGSVIRDTLMLDKGNNQPLDPIEPHIDDCLEKMAIYDDIVVDEGGCIGDILSTISTMYNCDIFYDRFGVLNVVRPFTYNRPEWYKYLAPSLRLDKSEICEDDLNVSFNFDGCNIVTVTTDNTNGKIYSYTAKNENPNSPVNINSIGYRGYNGDEGNGVVYIPLGDTNIVDGYTKCKDYAEFLLTKTTAMNTQISLEISPTPHLDVDQIISITNKYFDYDNQGFLVQSIDIPLSGENYSVGLSNIMYLPLDVY